MRISLWMTKVVTALGLLLLCGAALAGSPTELAVKSLLPDVFLRRIDTTGAGTPIVVFNPLSWTRTDAVEVESPFPNEDPNVRIVDSSGKVYPGRTLGDRLRFTARNVPALGYKVFWVSKSAKPVITSIKCTEDYVENQYFRVNVDKNKAVITSILDKASSRQLMPKDGAGALLQMLTDGKLREVNSDSVVTMMDSGPARGLLLLDNSYGDVPFVQELILNEGVPRIDIHMTAELPKTLTGTLSVSFPVAKEGIPTLGGLERIEDGVSVPTFKWLDVSDPKDGICLACSSAHNCSVSNSVISAELIRRTNGIDSQHELSYSLFTHSGDAVSGDVFERALEVAHPMVARLATKHKGELASHSSLLEVPKGAVVSLTGSERVGRSPQMCFYETNGKATVIEANLRVKGFYLLEAHHNGRPINATQGITDQVNVGLPASGTAIYLFVWNK